MIQSHKHSMVGAAYMRIALLGGLDYILRLHGEPAPLGGLDMLAPTILILLFYTDSIVSASPPRRASPLDCVYMEISSSPWRDLGY